MSTATSASAGTGKISGKARVPTRKLELVPEGDYLLEIVWVEKTMAKSGKPRLSFRFRVAAGPSKGRFVFEDCYLTDASIWKVSNLMVLCGYGESDEIDPNNSADLIEKFQGKQFKGTVKHETYTNKEGAEAKATRVIWNAPKKAGSAPKETADDKKSAAEGEIPF